MTGIACPAEFLAAIAAEYAELDDAKAGQFIYNLPKRARECSAARVIAGQLAGQFAMTKDLLGDVADVSRRHIEFAFVYYAWQRCEDALAEADQVSRHDAAQSRMLNMLARVRILALQLMGRYPQADELIQQLARNAKEQREREPYLAFIDLHVAIHAAHQAGELDQAKAFIELAGELLPGLGDDVRSAPASRITLLKALNLILMGQPQEAEVLIDCDLCSRTDDADVALIRIQAVRSQWRLKDAAALAEQAAAANPLPPLEGCSPDEDNITLHFLLASMYIHAHRFDDAGHILDKIISLAPYFIAAQALRCQLTARQGHWDQAVSDLKQLHERYPYDQTTLFELAFLQLVSYHYDEAAAWAEKLARTYRASSVAYEFMVAAFARRRLPDKAQDVAAEGLDCFPHSYGLRVQRGWARLAQQDFGSAQEDFQFVLNMVPLALDAKTGMAAIHFQQREYQKALELFRNVAAESAEAGPHANLAWALTAVGNDNKAKSECDLALKPGIPSASVLACCSVLAFRGGDLGQALRKAKEAVGYDPADLSCKVNLAALLTRKGDYEAARRLLEEVLSDDPLFAYAYLELGVLDAKTDSLESAGHHLSRAIDIDPRLSEAHQVLGVLDLKAGRLTAAEAHLREGLRWAPPADATLYVTLAQVLHELGDSTGINDYYQEALKELRTARQRDPGSNNALFELGAVRFCLGDIAGARRAFRQILDNDKDDPYAQVMLARTGRRNSMESFWLRAWSVALAVVASAQAAVAWIAFLSGKLSVTGLISLISLFAVLVVVAPLLPRLTKLHLAGIEADITQVRLEPPKKQELIAGPAPPFGLAPVPPVIWFSDWNWQ